MSQSKKNYCPLAENFPDAFAYCRTVLDCTGNPVKYIILDVNKAFEALTGITRSKLLGSEIVKVLKIIENTGAGVGFDWKGLFDKIFLNRKTARPELNLKLLDRWYEVTAYLDTKDNLITIFRDITSYKLTEKELQEKKQHLKKLLNSLDEGVWSHSLPDGRQLFDNLACEKIFGRPYKDFLHDPSLYERVIHPDDQNRNFVSEVIKKKKLVHKYRIFRPDGELRWLECKSWVTENEAGIPSRLEGIFRDITEQKLAEEALRKSEEKYRLLLENAHEAIVIAQDGMHKYVNPSAVRLFGYTKDELLSQSIDSFFHPDDRHIIIERHYRRFKGEKISGRATSRIITKNGRIRWVEHYNILIEWEGQPATLAFMLDLTERKEAEETLKESEDRFHYIADFSPLPLSIISEEGIFEYINPKFIEVFGYTLADIPTGKKWFELAFPDPLYRRQMINDFKNNIKKTGKNIVVPETGRVTCKDGSEKEILFRPVLIVTVSFW